LRGLHGVTACQRPLGRVVPQESGRALEADRLGGPAEALEAVVGPAALHLVAGRVAVGRGVPAETLEIPCEVEPGGRCALDVDLAAVGLEPQEGGPGRL